MNTKTLNIHEVTAHISELIRAVQEGDEVIIARDGQPVARLVPYRAPRSVRRFGVLAGQVKLHDDFDEPLTEDLLKSFEGEQRACSSMLTSICGGSRTTQR